MSTYYNSHSKRKELKAVGLITTLVFLFLFIFVAIPIIPAVQNFFIGVLGITVYPITILGVLIGLAFSTNRKFSMPKKNLLYLLVVAILFVSLLHVIFSSAIIKSYGKISFKNYGKYITDTFKLTSGITVGGTIISLLAYPFVCFFGIVGSSIVFAIALCVMLGFTIDYYYSRANKKEEFIKENWSRNLPDEGSFNSPSNDTIAGSISSYLSSTKVVPLKTDDHVYSEFLKYNKERNLDDELPVGSKNNLINEDEIKQQTEKLIPKEPTSSISPNQIARDTLYGNAKASNFKQNDSTLLTDEKAQMGYDPSKYSSLKEYIKYPYVPAVFIKTPEQKEEENNNDRSKVSLNTNINNDNNELDMHYRNFVEHPKDAVSLDSPEEKREIKRDNRSLPHTNPFNIDDLKIKDNPENNENIFEDDIEINDRNNRGNKKATSNNDQLLRFGDQMFNERDLRTNISNSDRNIASDREIRSNRDRMSDRMPMSDRGLMSDRNSINDRNIMSEPTPDNFGRNSVGVRGKDLSPRKSPERRDRAITNNKDESNYNNFTNGGLKNEPSQLLNPRSALFNNTPQKPKAEQIELPVNKSPFSQKGETDARYNSPPTTILVNNSDDPSKYGGDFTEKAEKLEEVLDSFKIPAKVIGVIKGPTVTKFELGMPVGIPVKKVLSYDGDIAMALMSKNGVRIEAPILGKNAVGVEIPNERRCVVGLREILESKEFQNSTAILPVAIGKNIYGETVVASMTKMIHLLVAGSTGSGKTVFLHNLILSLMYKSSPDQLRFILIDPKRVEFAIYNGMPHLILPNVVTECDKAINALTWAVKEMDRRYKVFQQNQTPNIELFNKCDAVKNGDEKKVPYIVIIVDELADLMLVGKREVESRIQRLAQLGRACGIFLVIATQRPSVEVVTGTIKSNLPTRIAFSLASFVDSRTILDEGGAEKLLGKGDMLYSPQDSSVATRLQAAYVETTDIKKVIDYIKDNNDIYFDDEIEQSIMSPKEEEDKQLEKLQAESDAPEYDEILPKVLKHFVETNSASTSMIQRRFKVGYARAARILDEMEVLGYVSPASGSKARNVYLTLEQYEEIFGADTGVDDLN